MRLYASNWPWKRRSLSPILNPPLVMSVHLHLSSCIFFWPLSSHFGLRFFCLSMLPSLLCLSLCPPVSYSFFSTGFLSIRLSSSPFLSFYHPLPPLCLCLFHCTLWIRTTWLRVIEYHTLKRTWECVNERCERMRELTSEWPGTYVPIFGLSKQTLAHIISAHCALVGCRGA